MPDFQRSVETKGTTFSVDRNLPTPIKADEKYSNTELRRTKLKYF